MKKLFIILCALFVAVLIALKVTSHKDETKLQTPREAPRGAQPTDTTQALLGGVGSTRPEIVQEANAVANPLRQQLEKEDRYKEIFAKELQWKEKFKGLKKGMTVHEVVAVMGEPPTLLLAVTNTGGTPVVVPTNAIQNVTSFAALYYSPDGVPPMDKNGLRADRLPFDLLMLSFDVGGKLESKFDQDEDPKERMRRELSENDRGQEMLAKEAEWKEKSKALIIGMTVQEAIAVMGRPTSQQQLPPEGQILLHYLPKGETSLYKMGGGGPLDDLTLAFDNNGKLRKINWR